MAVHARCRRKNCDFGFDDAEYVDDAIAKLRAHYRDVHPTKAFYENHHLEDIEIYNSTIDEHLERYVGIPNWRDQPNHNRHVIAACQQVFRYREDYTPDFLADAEAILRELGAEVPDADGNVPDADGNVPVPGGNPPPAVPFNPQQVQVGIDVVFEEEFDPDVGP